MKGIKNFIGLKNDDEKTIALSIIKFILNQNPNMDLQDKNGFTAFHYACLSSSEGLFSMILSKNPNVLLKDLKGKIGADYIREPKIKELYNRHFVK